MIKIVADIGATHSRFLISDGKTVRRINREGYNAATHERIAWQKILQSLDLDRTAKVEAYLYGAGFGPSHLPRIEEDFRSAFPQTQAVFLAKDLMGACRGMAQDKEAMVIIMGTGSNTCRYDGRAIVRNISPLGWALGDESSAASIGKALIVAFERDEAMPPELCDAFKKRYFPDDLTAVTRVYAEPYRANIYLGQFAKFAGEHIDHPYMRALVKTCMAELFAVLKDYDAAALPHYFTGSIAVHFEPILAELCRENGIAEYHVVPDYLDGIARYHGLM